MRLPIFIPWRCKLDEVPKRCPVYFALNEAVINCKMIGKCACIKLSKERTQPLHAIILRDELPAHEYFPHHPSYSDEEQKEIERLITPIFMQYKLG